MKYESFTIENYRAIESKLVVPVSQRIIPLVGVNECGKTTILKAIYCYDFTNDEYSDGEHLKCANLYKTEDEKCEITAQIFATKTTLDEFIEDVKNNENFDLDEDQQQVLEKFLKRNENTNGFHFEMTRCLKEISDEVECDYYFKKMNIEKISLEIQNNIGELMIDYLPYIIYSDDFNDRPKGVINIELKSEWRDIYDRVFVAAGKARGVDYSLSNLAKQTNDSRIDSILSDVENYLGDTLTDAWRRFARETKQIRLQLKLKNAIVSNKKSNLLSVKIEETLPDNSKRFFDINTRSKGFIWYYNFIMKIMYNSKQSGLDNNTIFLLDEPGSYLHENIQSSLCKNILEISKNEGSVIYCTHSPQLLNPTYIPTSKIMIVSKGGKKRITAKAIAQYKTKSKQKTALEPIYEALKIPEYKTFNINEKIVCVEGVYDKYAIEVFGDVSEEIIILPGSGATSIIDNIPYMIAYGIPYMVLWDNDLEGRKAMGKAEEKYGDYEAKNMYTLIAPSSKKDKFRMEEMFHEKDFSKIKDILGLDIETSYEIVMTVLYQNKKVAGEVKKHLNKYTNDNFIKINKMIEKHFKEM